MTLDLKFVEAFGFQAPKSTCWTSLIRNAKALRAMSIGQRKMFEKSLASNIDHSAQTLVKAVVNDIDTDTEYELRFDNKDRAWKVSISGATNGADILPEDIAGLQGSPLVQNIVRRAYKVVSQAAETFHNEVEEALDKGELLQIDELNSELVMSAADDSLTMDALKKGMFSKLQKA